MEQGPSGERSFFKSPTRNVNFKELRETFLPRLEFQEALRAFLEDSNDEADEWFVCSPKFVLFYQSKGHLCYPFIPRDKISVVHGQEILQAIHVQPKIRFGQVPCPDVVDLLRDAAAAMRFNVESRPWGTWVLKEALPDVPLDSSMYVKDTLKPHEAKLVDSHWNLRSSTSLAAIERCISFGMTSCVRYKGSPVAWALRKQSGSMGVVFVMKQHRRKGLGTFVMSDLGRKMIQQLHCKPYVFIADANQASIEMHTKLGFEFNGCHAAWMDLLVDKKDASQDSHVCQ